CLDEPPSQPLLAIFSGFDPVLIFSFVIIAILLLMSALISASEVAFFSLKSGDVDQFKESQLDKDKTVVDLIKSPRSLLATILILNNLVNVGAVTLSTYIMWELSGTRSPSNTIVGIVTFVATFAIT